MESSTWRLAKSALGHVEITRDGERYLLVVETHDGGRWEADATEAVQAAAAREAEVVYRRDREIQELRNTATVAGVAELQARIAAQEEELEFAREMLRRAADGGFLDQLGRG